jgi:hypothetical protein
MPTTAHDTEGWKRLGAAIALLILAASLASLGLWIGHSTMKLPFRSIWLGCFASFVFGASVGGSEILSRYRDEPVVASLTGAGIVYIALNGAISVAAFALLSAYPTQVFPNLLQGDIFLRATAAGFGAMVIFRSKLFTFRSSDGKDYPIGPSIVLDNVLKVIDAKIDRGRAAVRHSTVLAELAGVNSFNAAADFFSTSLLSFQNLSPDDKNGFGDVVKDIRSTNLPDQLKIMSLGFAFFTLVGEDNFKTVVDKLRSYLRPPAADPPN